MSESYEALFSVRAEECVAGAAVASSEMAAVLATLVGSNDFAIPSCAALLGEAPSLPTTTPLAGPSLSLKDWLAHWVGLSPRSREWYLRTPTLVDLRITIAADRCKLDAGRVWTMVHNRPSDGAVRAMAGELRALAGRRSLALMLSDAHSAVVAGREIPKELRARLDLS